MAKTSTRKGTSTKKAGRSVGRKTAKSATKKAAKATSRKAAKGSSRKAAKGSPRKAAKGSSSRRAAKRELIEPRDDKRFVRRGTAGQFTESDDVGRSLPTDRRKKARTKAKRGQGDKGDR